MYIIYTWRNCIHRNQPWPCILNIGTVDLSGVGTCTSSELPPATPAKAPAPATKRSTSPGSWRLLGKTEIHVTRIWLLCFERLSSSPASPVTGQPRSWWRQHHSFFLKLHFNGVTPMLGFRFLQYYLTWHWYRLRLLLTLTFMMQLPRFR